MKQVKKLLGSAVLVGLFTLALFIVPGISRVTQTQVYAASPKKAVQKLMRGIKNCDDKILNQYVKVKSGKGYYANISAKSAGLAKYIKKGNAKMKYKIKKIKVNKAGTTANAKLVVTIMDSDEYADNVVREFGKICMELANGTLSATSSDQFTERLFAEAEKATTPTKTKKVNITLRMVNVGGKWVLSNDTINDKFYTILSCNIPNTRSRMKEGFKTEINKLITLLAEQTGLSEDFIRTQFQPVIDKINASV